jgi:predicted dehydrogenase
MPKHRVAVIGAGAFGANHCRVVHESERAELTAVVDIDSARAQEAAAKYGATAFTDAREVAGKVSAAIVAAPTTAHEEIGALLMDAGIDVLVEKPIASDLAGAQRLIDAAEARGRILQVGHLERFNPAVIELERRATLL